MKTSALVLIDDSVCFTWLRDALNERLELVQISGNDDAALRQRIADETSAAMLFLQFDGGQQEQRTALTEWIAEVRPDLPVIALALGEQPDLMLAAMRAGARDFVVPDRDAELLSAVEKALRRKASVARASKGRGGIYTVTGAQPIDGIPFLAMHLALAIREQLPRDERVLLIDCSFPAGAAQVFLNIEQSYDLANAAKHVYRCDQTLIDTAFAQHDSGLYVLALDDKLVGPCSIDPGEMRELLDHLSGFFAAIVVAVDSAAGAELVAATLSVTKQSLLLTDQSILKSRQNKQFVAALRQADAPVENMGLVVDNYKRRLGLEPEKLASILEIAFLDTIEGSGVERIQAMNTGSPMFSVAPRDRYCDDVRRLASRLTGKAAATAPAESKGLLNRLLS